MNIIKELWHGNIIPQEDSRTNSKEMKELLGYMARHHEDLEKTFTEEQKEVFEKFHDCWSEYMSLAEAVYLSMHSSSERGCQWKYSLIVNQIPNEDRCKSLSFLLKNASLTKHKQNSNLSKTIGC